MKTAYLYIHVSTDEQAQKGYSQRNQEEKLNKYCKDNRIEIIQTIFEDHSVNNFDRSVWSIMMRSLISGKTRGQVLFCLLAGINSEACKQKSPNFR